jgi:hypothetical protein
MHGGRTFIEEYRMRRVIATVAGLLCLLAASSADADAVRFRSGAKVLKVEGNVLAKDSLGVMLLEARDGQRFMVSPRELVEWTRSDEPVDLFSKQQLRASLSREMGGRFQFLHTSHYLICYSCDTDYAKEASKLLERAYAVFTNYFNDKGGFKFKTPAQPLIAIICASREEYVSMVGPKLGPMAQASLGVYIPMTNRMYMYNALGGKTGQMLHQARRNNHNTDEVVLLLREQNISVVIHEAVHQIAFNVGFHHRQGSLPAWLVEGMAMFFETPDLDARGGWKGVGNLNKERLEQFQKNFNRRSKDSIGQLIVQDEPFQQRQTALDAYADAWALTYYLAKSKTASYVRFIKLLNARPELAEYTPEQRLKDFVAAFRQSPQDMEMDFRRYMSKIRVKRSDE